LFDESPEKAMFPVGFQISAVGDACSKNGPSPADRPDKPTS
jgi:hypothetical protein